MTHYTPPVPFEESQASKTKWSDLIPAIYGKVAVAWEDVEPKFAGGTIDIIMFNLKGEIIVGGWDYDFIGDEWERAEPQDLKEAFEDGFIVTPITLAPQWAAQIRKISPANQVNLALEEVLDYVGIKEEIDCE